MIRWSTSKAVTVGVAVLILAQILYLGVLLRIEHHELLRATLLFFPGVAALTTAYIAPNRKILTGVSLALWGAALAMLSASLYELFGLHVDSIGRPFATFVILVVYFAISSTVGSTVGYFLSHHKSDVQDKSVLDKSE